MVGIGVMHLGVTLGQITTLMMLHLSSMILLKLPSSMLSLLSVHVVPHLLGLMDKFILP